MDAFRCFAIAIAQGKTAKKRLHIWDQWLRNLAENLVPEWPEWPEWR